MDNTPNDATNEVADTEPSATELSESESPETELAEPDAVVDLAVDERTLADARRAIEAILMVSEEPADPRLLAQLIELPVATIDTLCEQMAADLIEEGRGFRMAQVAGGWRFQSADDLSPYVERFVLTGQSARLSAAALETLAIVAYKQPISRAQVSAIRGVNVDGVMRTLQQRGYIAELARDPGPGQAVLFGTTASFLERLGLNSLSDLPALGEFIPGADVVEALEAGLRLPEEMESEADAPDGAPVDAVHDDAAHADADDVVAVAEVAEADVADTDAVDAEAAEGDALAADAVIDLRDSSDEVLVAGHGSASSGLDALDVLADEPDVN